MFELLGRLWAAITGSTGKKQEKAAKQDRQKEQNKLNKESAKNITNAKDIPNTKVVRNTQSKQNLQNIQCAGERGNRTIKRQYAGRLPICAGCMNIGGCVGFFPGCGCYGSSHDTVKVSAGDWHGMGRSRGSSIASPEFAAWCAFMGYPVAERYWAEYEDVWNYYEEALHEYGSEYEFFDEYADLGHHVDGDRSAYDYDEYACDEHDYDYNYNDCGAGDCDEHECGDGDAYGDYASEADEQAYNGMYDDDYDYSHDDE